jgi:hypothetical protein
MYAVTVGTALMGLTMLAPPRTVGADPKPSDKPTTPEQMREILRSCLPDTLGGMTPKEFVKAYPGAGMVLRDPTTNEQFWNLEMTHGKFQGVFIDGKLASFRKIILSHSRHVRPDLGEKLAFGEAKSIERQLGKPDIEGTHGLPEDEQKITVQYKAWIVAELGLKFECAVRVTEVPNEGKKHWLLMGMTNWKALPDAEMKDK